MSDDAMMLPVKERDGLRSFYLTLRYFKKRRPFLSALAVLVVILFFTSISIGAYTIPLQATFFILLDTLWPGADMFSAHYAAHEDNIMMSIRLPRVLAAVMVGGVLGISGAVLQSLFRNPLAEPGLIGVSSGAALAAVAVIVLVGTQVMLFGFNITPYILPFAAFTGGLLATFIVYLVGRKAFGETASTMLLVGVAINAVAMAGIGIFQFLSDETQLRLLTFWLMGGLGSITWQALLPVACLCLLGVGGLIRLSVPLNAYLMGPKEARHLGVNVQKMTRQAILFSALIVGAVVSVSGIISFVGLIVPHLVRQICGPDNRIVIPGAALAGAGLLLLADLIARTLIAPSELPVGLVTSAIGGPFFLWLIVRRKKERFA